VVVRVVPTVNEYYTIKRAVDTVAPSSSRATVAEPRKAFDRSATGRVLHHLVSGNELEITKENDKVKIHFAYEPEIAALRAGLPADQVRGPVQ
jgi:hypothetical protein